MRVYQAHDGAAELLGLLHQALRLAVALGLRAAEIASDAAFQVGALLLGDDRHLAAIDAPDAAHDSAVVGERAVAMQLDEIIEQGSDVIQRRRPLGVARELHALPGAVRRGGLLRPGHGDVDAGGGWPGAGQVGHALAAQRPPHARGRGLLADGLSHRVG